MVRLLVVDDHKIVRKGFVLMFEPEQDIEVIGEAADGEEAIQQGASVAPAAVSKCTLLTCGGVHDRGRKWQSANLRRWRRNASSK